MSGRTDTEMLLTDEERNTKLESLFGHRFTERGNLQLPTVVVYNSLKSDEGLQKLAFEMCRWTGTKPNGLSVKYADNDSAKSFYSVDAKHKVITINRQFRAHPYTGAATLALAVTDYCIEKYSKSVPDKAFVEFATIELGLGLWVVNALKPKLKFSERLYHLIDSAWFHAEGIQLISYTTEQYMSRLATHAHENRISSEVYTPHISQRCQYLLPTFVQHKKQPYLPVADVILRHRRTARLVWTKIILIALIITSGITLGIYGFSQRSANEDPKPAQLQSEIRMLKNSYNACTAEASTFQSTTDPNDLFMTRQTDAIKSKCESLRNEYNFAIDQYNKTYLNY